MQVQKTFAIVCAAMGAALMAGHAVAGSGCWDLFSVSLLDDYYWNMVNGCAQEPPPPFGDELFIPPGPPDGTPIITTSTKLGGMMYAFGGHDWNWEEEGTADLEWDKGSYEIESTSQSDHYLSVILDTATDCDMDELFPSWGEIKKIEVYQSNGLGGWNVLIPGEDFEWHLSPCDAGSTWEEDGTFTNVSLAVQDFNDHNTWKATAEDPPEDESQDMAVWGVGTMLPAGHLYHVEFSTDIYTWDSYNLCWNEVRVPAPATLSGLLLAGLFARRRRR